MIYKNLGVRDAAILIWHLTETEEELKGMLSNFELYKAEYEKLHTSKRRKEFLASRVALNSLHQCEFLIAYDANGKPFVDQNTLQISISHCASWVAVITHPLRQVGIDIELPSDKFRSLYVRFLNKVEQEALFDTTDLLKVQLAWSAKEALYKIIGEEAVNFAEQLEVLGFEMQQSGYFYVMHSVRNKKYTMYYVINEFFNLVYCIG
ncbi:MAG: hypothetical protein AUK44_03685 [Porphyromonadaceae bacterium CG2_30_38_12]|nr:MAG: hypothetical protein AUK44_03685 [Porphyromonadaceae bacterium CG2_30_38_12]